MVANNRVRLLVVTASRRRSPIAVQRGTYGSILTFLLGLITVSSSNPTFRSKNTEYCKPVFVSTMSTLQSVAYASSFANPHVYGDPGLAEPKMFS